jgi:hypothetical protein
LNSELELSDESLARLRECAFVHSNSRELRNAIEQAAYRHHRQTDVLDWSHLQPFIEAEPPATTVKASAIPVSAPSPKLIPMPPPNEWQPRLRALAVKILNRSAKVEPDAAQAVVDHLFDHVMPDLWSPWSEARSTAEAPKPIPMPVWDDLWRCFAVGWLGGPAPAERELGIPANTLRQWINDRESR